MNLYQNFRNKKATAADLAAALQLLSWDQEIYMPMGGANFRARQLGTLAEVRHEIIVKEIEPMLAPLLADASLTPFERRNVEQTAVEVAKAVKLPKEFVAKQAQQMSQAQTAWERAKAADDFSLFEAQLTETFALKRQEAEYYGYTTEPYDALLDTYDTGVTAAFLDRLFVQMRLRLQSLVLAIGRAPQVDTAFLNQKIDRDKQWQFSLRVLRDMGFDFERGRQDISTHPFTSGISPDDVRLTTHIDEYNINMMLYSTIHEGGHGLYEQGLPADFYGLPVAEACSLSIHESQSRIWENNVARSQSYWEYYFNDFAALFPDRLRNQTPADVYKAVNAVKPSLIRIMADELTYHFHIMIRFELEREILSGELLVKDLPEAWNAKYKNYLGVEPASDAEGVLQDIHWSIGAIGYFPTYSLGSFYAAQLYHYARQENPHLHHQFAEGKFDWFKNWLNDRIFIHGRLYSSEELCIKATGEPLNVDYFLNYIQQKLQTVYQVELTV